MRNNNFYIEKEKLQNKLKTERWLIEYEFEKKANPQYIISKVVSYSIKNIFLKNRNNRNFINQVSSEKAIKTLIKLIKKLF